MTYRRSPDRLLRIHSQLPRVRGARREHGIPARDGEEFTLTVEHVDSDLIQGVHLATDAFLVLSGARYERSVTVLFGPETSTELEARPRSLRGSTTVPGDGGTEYRIECHTKEGTLWLWNVCAYDSQGVRMVRSGDMASGMLVEDLADGYRYRCNDIGNDDDYDDLVFRVERTGASEPPPPPKEHSPSRRPR